MIDFNSFDPLTGRTNTTRVFVIGGRVRRTSYFIRLFTYPELVLWLEHAGFVSTSVFGGDGCEFTMESPRMVTLARKDPSGQHRLGENKSRR
jgi:hypothetical protein